MYMNIVYNSIFSKLNKIFYQILIKNLLYRKNIFFIKFRKIFLNTRSPTHTQLFNPKFRLFVWR